MRNWVRGRGDLKENLCSGEIQIFHSSPFYSKIKFRTSKGGNEYTTFSLIESSGESIRVFTWGHPKIKEGQKVKVTGTYRKVKKIRRYTFYNEIEAVEVK